MKSIVRKTGIGLGRVRRRHRFWLTEKSISFNRQSLGFTPISSHDTCNKTSLAYTKLQYRNPKENPDPSECKKKPTPPYVCYL